MNKNQKSLLLVLSTCIGWGLIMTIWLGGDNLDPWFVVAWAMVASFALMATVWAMSWIATAQYHGNAVPMPVPVRPRNRRIR
jgi:hypothetical protein